MNPRELLTPSRIFTKPAGLVDQISNEATQSYLDAVNQVVRQTNSEVTKKKRRPVVTAPLDEGADINIEVSYSPSLRTGLLIPTMSELVVSTPDLATINQITFAKFEFDPKNPGIHLPTAFGRYKSPASRYLVDYTPTDAYVGLISAVIKDRTEKGLFRILSSFEYHLTLSQ